MTLKVITIGVYGFDENRFFQALLDTKIDIFCDIRMRRGMRGREYAFVNSARLQQKLAELGIKYVYMKELAPSMAVRDKQKQADEQLGEAKRVRKQLGQAFIEAYEQECLAHFDAHTFIEQIEQVEGNAHVVGLFCVEREPDACHRSLVANRLVQDLQIEVTHIKP